jgi:hypothetical protein
MKNKGMIILSLVLVTVPTMVWSNPFPSEYAAAGHGGHWYALTLNRSTWDDAETEAVAVGGHLVTIDDLAENAWLAETFKNALTQNGNDNIAWLGLQYISGDRNDSTSWQWVSNGQSPTIWPIANVTHDDGIHMYLHGNNHIKPETWNWGKTHDIDSDFYPFGIIEIPEPSIE